MLDGFTMQDKLKLTPWLLNLGLIILCLAPIGNQVPQPFKRSDLFYHALAYIIVSLAFYATQYSAKRVFPILFLQGITIEFIQPYFGRFFEGLDIVANGLGVVLGFGLAQLLFKFYPEYGPKKSTGPSRKTSE